MPSDHAAIKSAASRDDGIVIDEAHALPNVAYRDLFNHKLTLGAIDSSFFDQMAATRHEYEFRVFREALKQPEALMSLLDFSHLDAPRGPAPHALSYFSIPTANSRPTSIVLDGFDRPWFTESSSDKIGHLTAAGAIEEANLPAGCAPDKIVATTNGNFWISCYKRASLVGLSPTGTQAEYHLLNGPASALAADENGGAWFIYRSSSNSSAIGRVDSHGTITMRNLPTAVNIQNIIGDTDGNVHYLVANPWFGFGTFTPDGRTSEYSINNFPWTENIDDNGALWIGAGGALIKTDTNGAATVYPLRSPCGGDGNQAFLPESVAPAHSRQLIWLASICGLAAFDVRPTE